jgi:hypothetical protein
MADKAVGLACDTGMNMGLDGNKVSGKKTDCSRCCKGTTHKTNGRKQCQCHKAQKRIYGSNGVGKHLKSHGSGGTLDTCRLLIVAAFQVHDSGRGVLVTMDGASLKQLIGNCEWKPHEPKLRTRCHLRVLIACLTGITIVVLHHGCVHICGCDVTANGQEPILVVFDSPNNNHDGEEGAVSMKQAGNDCFGEADESLHPSDIREHVHVAMMSCLSYSHSLDGLFLLKRSIVQKTMRQMEDGEATVLKTHRHNSKRDAQPFCSKHFCNSKQINVVSSN